jgi:hypothetical protein
MKQEQMPPQKAHEIMNAFARYNHLTANSSAIITADSKRDEAEITGLRNFLHNTLLQYTGELMGCWLAVRQEWEPMCQSFAALLTRAEGMRAEHAAERAARLAAEKEAVAK